MNSHPSFTYLYCPTDSSLPPPPVSTVFNTQTLFSLTPPYLNPSTLCTLSKAPEQQASLTSISHLCSNKLTYRFNYHDFIATFTLFLLSLLHHWLHVVFFTVVSFYQSFRPLFHITKYSVWAAGLSTVLLWQLGFVSSAKLSFKCINISLLLVQTQSLLVPDLAGILCCHWCYLPAAPQWMSFFSRSLHPHD